MVNSYWLKEKLYDERFLFYQQLITNNQQPP